MDDADGSIDNDDRGKTLSDNLNHLAEFLDIPNCCSEIQGLIFIFWIPMLQGSLTHIYLFYNP